MTYNPGNQSGKGVQSGGQRPTKHPGGPFLGKAQRAENRMEAIRNPRPRTPVSSGRSAEKESSTPRGIKSNNATSRRSRGISRLCVGEQLNCRRERDQGAAFSLNRRSGCPEVLVAVHTSRLSCRERQYSRRFGSDLG